MNSPNGKTSSIGDSTVEEGLEMLDYEEGIVLYEVGPPCTASRMACRFLKARG
jgi:hypothetical protein